MSFSEPLLVNKISLAVKNSALTPTVDVTAYVHIFTTQLWLFVLLALPLGLGLALTLTDVRHSPSEAMCQIIQFMLLLGSLEDTLRLSHRMASLTAAACLYFVYVFYCSTLVSLMTANTNSLKMESFKVFFCIYSITYP